MFPTYFAVLLWASLDVVEALVQADSTDREASWRAARGALVLGVLAEEEAEENALYRRAEAHAVRVLAMDSLDVEGLY